MTKKLMYFKILIAKHTLELTFQPWIHCLYALRCILLTMFKSWLKITLSSRGEIIYIWTILGPAFITVLALVSSFSVVEIQLIPELYTFIIKEKYPELC